jgi:hypothetical protein
VCHVVQIQVQTFAVHSVQDMEMDDLEAELAELEAEELDNQLLEPAPVPAGEATECAALDFSKFQGLTSSSAGALVARQHAFFTAQRQAVGSAVHTAIRPSLSSSKH